MDKKYLIVAAVIIYGIYDAYHNSDYINTSIVMLLGIAIFLSGRKEAKKAVWFRFFSILSILGAAGLYIYKIVREAGIS